MLTILIYSNELVELINACYNYWPANKVSEVLHTEIEAIYRNVMLMLRGYRWLAMVTCSMIVPLRPFLAGKQFPVEMWQPIDLSFTPRYQITFFLQTLAGYFASFINIGFDSLFVGIMTITICQVQVCGKAFKILNFKDIKTKKDEEKCWAQMNECIQYHNHLIR